MTGKRRRGSALFSVGFSLLMVLSVGAPSTAVSAGTPALTADEPLATGAAAADGRYPSHLDAARSTTAETAGSATETHAANETIATCTVIDSNGTYQLTQNITGPADERCIRIDASDVVLDGNGHTIRGNGSRSGAGHPIYVEGSNDRLSNVTIRDVRVVHWPKNVHFDRVDNATVESVVIRNFSDSYGLWFIQSSNVSVVDTRLTNNQDGIGVIATPRSRIRRTTVKNSGTGIRIATRGPLRSSDNATIRNSTVTDGSFGIRSYKSENVSIVNNTIRANGRIGLRFKNGANSRIVDNTFTNNDRWGILVRWSNNITVVDNTLRQNGYGGMILDGSNHKYIYNNTVRQNDGDGISLSRGDHNIVRNNTVVANNEHGVSLHEVSNTTVENNVLRNNSQIGVYVRNNVLEFRVAGNRIRDNRRGVSIRGGPTSGTIERNRIVNNTDVGIHVQFNTPADLITIRRNVIARHDEYGIKNENDDIVVDAENNWWGEENGPSSPASATKNLTDPVTGAVANGTGDAVSENGSNANVSNVHFDPWLGTAPRVGGEELRITTVQLPPSKLGDPVGHRIETRGGSPPVASFEVVTGALPPGMELHDNGTLNGTPTATGNFTFTVRVTDGEGATANRTFMKQVSATIPSPVFEVEKGSSGVTPGGTQLYLIQVENTGSTVARNVSTTEYLEPWFTFEDASGSYNHTTEVLIEGSRFGVDGNYSRGLVTWNTSRLDPGETVLLTYQVRLTEGFPVGGTVRGEACSCDGGCQEFKRCRKRVTAGCKIPSSLATGAGLIKGGGDAIAALLGASAPIPGPVGAVCDMLGTGAICSRTARASDAFNLGPGGSPGGSCAEDNTTVEGASDPNEKVAATDRFVQPDQTLPYTVRFENVGNGSARNVTVTDKLPPNLNTSTVRVVAANGSSLSLDPGETVTLLRRNQTVTRNATVGNETVTRNVTVTEHHTATLRDRTVRWHLENIYLPPNGTGELLLSVDPERGLPDGARIENNATIRFDEVSRLTTDDTVTVIDSVSPTCRVQSLPARSPRDVTLTWTGTDPVGRIDEVTIFHSTDGETWDVARSGIGQHEVTVSTLTSNLGRTHRFMCIAEDSAGNTETQTPGAEATTTTAVVDVTGTVLEADGSPAANDTITIVDSSRARYTTAVFTAEDATEGRIDHARTDRSGRYSFTTDVNTSKDLAYYQAHPAYFRGVNGTSPTASTTFPRDGSPDLCALSRATPSDDGDFGTRSLPSAHVVNVTVVDDDGNTVENATIQFEHIGPDEQRATVTFPNATNANGVFVPEGADRPGLELVGSVNVSVLPPADDREYADLVTTRSLTVDSDRDVTIEVELRDTPSEDNGSLVVDAGLDTTIDEGATLNRTGSITGRDSMDWSGTVTYGDGTGPVPLSIDERVFDLNHTYVEDGDYSVTVTVSDGIADGTDIANVTVTNVAPNVSVSIEDPVDEGSSQTLNATIDDPGIMDAHDLTIRWGDGNTTTETVDRRAETSTVTVRHTYFDDGSYNVSVIATDDDGGRDFVTTTALVDERNEGSGGSGGDWGGGGQPGGGAQGEVEITNLSLLNTTATTGASIVTRVDLANFDPAAGRTTLTLSANGSVVTERTLSVGASTERTVDLVHRFGQPGTYVLRVGGSRVGTVTVTAADTPTPTPRPTAAPTETPTATPPDTPTPTDADTPTGTTAPSTPSTTTGDGAGFGIVSVVVAFGLFIQYRRD
ncbi:MAG: right-handed parallel beta-helix repeat-containing protein [Haloarculaceae archaeon]